MNNTENNNHIAYLDELTGKSAKLKAMLNVAYGEGFESFNNMSDDNIQNYLWACAELANEISETTKHLGDSIS